MTTLTAPLDLGIPDLSDPYDGADCVSSAGPCCAPAATLQMETAVAQEWAQIFKAFGHPVRLQIIDILSRHGGQVCVCDIESQFSLSQPTISHHLKILRRAGLIESHQRGLWVFYDILPVALDGLQQLLANLQRHERLSPAGDALIGEEEPCCQS